MASSAVADALRASLATLALLAGVCFAAVDPAREAARNRPRRILFNDDGGETRVPTRPLPQPTDFLPARIAPLGWQHVNLTGDYLWDTPGGFGPDGFRSLRGSPHALADAA